MSLSPVTGPSAELIRYAHGSNRIARTCMPCVTAMLPMTRASAHWPRSARIGCPACMNGNYSSSPKKEGTTGRPDRDPVATQDDPAKLLTQDRRFWLQRQGPVLDDTLHDEGGAEPLDAGEGGEALIVELLIGGQVGGDDAQQVVGLTEEPLGLPDVGDGRDSLFERVDGGAVPAAHSDEDQSFEGQAECVGVEVCVVATDGAEAFQGAQPAVAG